MDRRLVWLLALVLALAGVPAGVAIGRLPVLALLGILVVGQAVLLAGVYVAAVASAVGSLDAGRRPGSGSATDGETETPAQREWRGRPLAARIAVASIVTLGAVVPAAAGPGPVRGLAAGVGIGTSAWAVLSLLGGLEDGRPSTADRVDALVARVDYETFRSASDHPEYPAPVRDLLAVTQRSLDHRDYRGALAGIDGMEQASRRVLEGYVDAGDDLQELDPLVDYWEDLGRTALDLGTGEVLDRVVGAEAATTSLALELGASAAAGRAVEALADVCEHAVDLDRFDEGQVEALEELLLASVEVRDPAVHDVIAGVDRVRIAVERRGTDPDDVLQALAVSLLRAQALLVETEGHALAEEWPAGVYARLEEAIDDCVGDLLVTDASVTPVGEALVGVGVVAAELDHQWIVRRVAVRIIDLHSAAEDRYEGAEDHVQRIHDAGGEDGVQKAFDHVRATYDDTGAAPTLDDPVSRFHE